ncbi:Glycosyl phosphatidyl inositol anchor synthesis [Chytridiales sp. JEL 0842]|nr:Glycosyl phosphatidyl inositol anchor synthesis [Chytridiales sp. JEL 0842]
MAVKADGLRADKLYENGIARSPYLREVVTSKGSWGVSHTRVPTESRPGHVALIAGFYEDVSAVTKGGKFLRLYVASTHVIMHSTGWKTNPVDFDSLFNETHKTWSFGSPDILPMFAKGTTDPNKVEMFMYPAESEDFAEDASKLDTWVFEKFDELLANSTKEPELSKDLQSEQIVLFFHLLGLDTNGHAHRPYSKEYLNNIKLVDEGISKVVKKIEAFYKHDKRTAYVFTADHGMSNRGNHGDGHPDNTKTPLIAWGAGIAEPVRLNSNATVAEDEVWGIEHLKRNDVNQADIAPLMSTLIGVPYPKNSVGVLPLAYLRNTEQYKATAAFGNAKQILMQFLVKEESKRRTEIVFTPYKPLIHHEKLEEEIQQLIGSNQIALAEQKSLELTNLCLEGLRYYQTYDWGFLRSIISIGYVGWIAYSLSFVLKTYCDVSTKLTKGKQTWGPSNSSINTAGFIVSAAFAIFLYLKDSSPNYYFYVFFMIYLWVETAKEHEAIMSMLSYLTRTGQWVSSIVKLLMYVAVLEVLVLSYFRREILTPGLLIAGFGWPLSLSSSFRSRNWRVVVYWIVSCTCTSMFTLLPVETVEDMTLVTWGGVVIILSGVAAAVLLPAYFSALPTNKASRRREFAPTVIITQIALTLFSTIVVNDTSRRLKAKEGLPLLNQIISWFLLSTCVVIPAMDIVKGGHHFLRRLIVIYLAFAPVFVLLSISYEALFYFCFSQMLLAWLLMEKQVYSDVKGIVEQSNDYKDVIESKANKSQFRSLTSTDLRIASTFLFFINVAFFGTGNIASVSSFSLDSVYRFTTVFNPFLMAALLIFKMWVPFFLLSAILGVVSRLVDLPAFNTINTIHIESDGSTITSQLSTNQLSNRKQQQVYDTESLKIIQDSARLRSFKATGFKYCSILDNAHFNAHVYINDLNGTILERNPSMTFFTTMIDDAARDVAESILKSKPNLHVMSVIRYSCYITALGVHSLYPLSKHRLLHSLDPITYLKPVLPAIIPHSQKQTLAKPAAPSTYYFLHHTLGLRFNSPPEPRRRYRLAYWIGVEGGPERLDNLKLLVDELDDGSALILIHIDSRPSSDTLRKTVEQWVASRVSEGVLGNVFLAKATYPNVPGHPSNLWMMLSGFYELMDLADWDAVINLSVFDYPLRKSREIHRQLILANSIGKNIVDHWSEPMLCAERSIRPHLSTSSFLETEAENIIINAPDFGFLFPPFPSWKLCRQQPYMILPYATIKNLRESEEAIDFLAYLEFAWTPDQHYFCTVFLNAPIFRRVPLLTTSKRFMYFYKNQPTPAWLTPEWKHLFPADALGTEPPNLFISTVDVRTKEGDELVKWVQVEHVMRHLVGVDSLERKMEVNNGTLLGGFEGTVEGYGEMEGAEGVPKGRVGPAEGVWVEYKKAEILKRLSKVKKREGEQKKPEEGKAQLSNLTRMDFLAPLHLWVDMGTSFEDHQVEQAATEDEKTFEDLGLHPWLLESINHLAIKNPTEIQIACIPPTLEGKDVIGGARTGSGKTAAFALPILQKLAEDPFGVFALVLTPTRELAFQIAEQFRAFGTGINLKQTVVVGGMDMMTQALELSRRPHIVVATPGRLVDLLRSSSDAVNFKRLKFLVLDEVDRLLEDSFAEDLEEILNNVPKKRQTLLFTATMTAEIESLQFSGSSKPFIYQCETRFQTVEKLDQRYLFIPSLVRDPYLTYLLRNNFSEKTMIIFTSKCRTCERLRVMLRELGVRCTALHAQMSQSERLGSIAKFKGGSVKILITTDVGSRGLDIPSVQLVLNYELPADAADYVHRVGRTARAGRGGMSISLVTERDVDILQNIEGKINKKLEEFSVPENEVLELLNEVGLAKRVANMHLVDTKFGEKKTINETKRKILDPTLTQTSKHKSKKAKKQ